MNKLVLIALCLISSATLAQANMGSCDLGGAKTAAEAWKTAFEGNEPSHVVDLYAADGILNPTLSNSIVSNQSDRMAHFTGLFEKLRSRTVDFTNTSFREINGVVMHSGHWTFRGILNGKESEIKARVSFVYAGNDCLIHDHHSSVFPLN